MNDALLGVKPINKYLNKWLEAHGFDCTVCLGTDFSYDCINDIIYYAFVVADAQDKNYIKVCQECREEIGEVDNFILSFFHELGHFETQDAFSEEEWRSYEKLCERINQKETSTLEDYNAYWHHPVELEATQWGCDYIIDNYDIVKEWWDNLKPLILDFIKLNNIELDEEE